MRCVPATTYLGVLPRSSNNERLPITVLARDVAIQVMFECESCKG